MLKKTKNYETKSMLVGEFHDYLENGEFVKLKDLVGKYSNGEFPTYGLIMLKNNYASADAKGLDKVNIFMVAKHNDNIKLVQLPHKLGVEIVEDFNNSSETAEQYFTCIKEVTVFKTKFGLGANLECY